MVFDVATLNRGDLAWRISPGAIRCVSSVLDIPVVTPSLRLSFDSSPRLHDARSSEVV